jgi:hypothetical protein
MLSALCSLGTTARPARQRSFSTSQGSHRGAGTSIMRSRRNITLCIALIAALASISPAMARDKMFRWIDANGTPVLSDRPPPAGTAYTLVDPLNQNSQSLRRRPDASSEPASSSVQSAISPTLAGARVVIEKKPELCERARDNIFKLETFPRIRATDADGTVRFLTDQERAERLNTARAVEQANC